MISCDTLIIGAGPSGLSAAYRLLANGIDDFLILEASDTEGGLCRSLITEGGAVFDIGGHSFHTPHPEVHRTVNALMKRYGGMYYQKRDARIMYNGVEIDYPFQQNFINLPDEELKESCLAGLETVKNLEPDTSNLLAHLYTKFGFGITDAFMRPYNEKLWKVNLERIIPSWSGERIASASKQQFDKSGIRKPLESDTHVGYPSLLGFEAIFKAMADVVGRHRILYNAKVTGLFRTNSGTVTVIAHRFGVPFIFEAKRVISTVPLNILAKMIPTFSDQHDGIEDDLFHTSLLLHLVEVDEYAKGDETPQRLYVHSDDCPAHKIAFNNLSSGNWTMTDSKAIMFEVSYFGEKPLKQEIRAIQSKNLDFLARHGYIKSSVPRSESTIDVKFSYPMYTLGYRQVVDTLKSSLSELGIHSIGRFGSWSYMNSDGCIHEAFTLVDSLQ